MAFASPLRLAMGGRCCSTAKTHGLPSAWAAMARSNPRKPEAGAASRTFKVAVTAGRFRTGSAAENVLSGRISGWTMRKDFSDMRLSLDGIKFPVAGECWSALGVALQNFPEKIPGNADEGGGFRQSRKFGFWAGSFFYLHCQDAAKVVWFYYSYNVKVEIS